MKAIDRLNQIKSNDEESLTIERFVSLTNPKNVSLMEALVAWTCVGSNFKVDDEVDESATINDLWQLCNINTKGYADTAGISISEALSKIRQLKNLGIIYPDGTASGKATSIVKVYVKGKIEGF